MLDRDASDHGRDQHSRRGTTDSIFEIRNVTVEFGMERGTSRVLDDVTLDVYENEILGIIGESGSGKSMLASSLLDAVVAPGTTTGEILYHEDNEPYDVLNLNSNEMKSYRWEEVSMVFQGAMNSFNPTMKIEEHFRETITRHGVAVETGMKRARELLSDLHLNPERVLRSYAHELSGGMRQRTLLALSLVLNPEVVVMDEPTASLDLLMQRAILSLLENLKDKYNLTIIFITHDLPLVTDLADRLAVMYAFDIVEIGSTIDVLSNPSHPYTRELLMSTPSLETVTEEMEAIGGSSPDPVNPPSGCSYHPRCPLADDQCETEEPPLDEVSPGHQSACFYSEAASEKIPLENTLEDL
ncbi:ABC transporter ATP-binding protein [Halovenus marina]|uniref:ABC transporter ATP-binding protein n=1 Tax=Halovenus marina TaxID=3396621 RepID=UPI003F557D4D